MKTGKYNAPFALYGYQKHNNSLIIDPVAGNVIMRMFEMLDTGYSTTQVATIFNSEEIPTPAEYKKAQNIKRKWNSAEKKAYWTDTTIRRLATDERYTGKMIFGKKERTKVGDPCSAKAKPPEEWIVIDDTHPALVTKERFESVNKNIHIRSKHHGNKVNHMPSIYCCGNCGHVLQKSGHKNITLKCRYSVMNAESKCLCEGIKLDDLHEILKSILSKQFEIMQCEAKKYKQSIYATSGVSTDVINGEIVKLKKERFNSYEKFKNGEISRKELDVIRGNIAERMVELEELLRNADADVEISEIKTHKADTILNYGSEYEFDERFINYFIKQVKIHNDNVIDITWNFGLDEFLNKIEGKKYE